MAKKRVFRFTKNPQFITVKKCCASCIFKGYANDLEMRRCKLHHADVKPQDVCRKWQMSKQMELAGTPGDGRVKCREYLMYVLEVREAEIKAEEQGQQVEVKTIEEIRQLFEQEHGTIYMNI